MLKQRVSMFETKGDNGGVKTTIVVENMSEKVKNLILADLYGIGMAVQNTAINGYVSKEPTKSEATAMEEVMTDTSDMELRATATEYAGPSAEEIAENFFNTTYDNSPTYEKYLNEVVCECQRASAEGDTLQVKAMYIAADRILQGDYSQAIPALQTYLYYCSYMPLFKETFRAVAEQKGVYFDGASADGFRNSIITLLQQMTLEDMQAVIAAVETKY